MDNDTPENPPPLAKHQEVHRKPGRPAKVRLVPREPAPPTPTGEDAKLFAGMTPKLCASGCNPEKGCIISGDICVHPYISGGLQAPHQMKPDVRRRFDRARDYLKHQAINQRKEA